MVYTKSSTFVRARQYPETTAERLSSVLASVPIDNLLKLLTAPTGRRGYGVRVLWNAYIACFVLNTASISEALRRIEDDPRLSEVVGGTPTKYAVCRFIRKLKGHTAPLERCMAAVTVVLKEHLPDLGQTVTVDSTDIKSWSRKTDPDGAWSAKQGNDGHKKFWHGFKAHVTCDARYELPLDVFVSPANASDFRQIQPSLSRLSVNGFKPQHVLADAGYDSAENYRVIVDDFHAFPIIKLNMRGKRKECFNIPHRTVAYVAAHKRGLELRQNPGIDRNSEAWTHLYSMRGSAERVFSRLKEFRRLNRLTMCGILKTMVHCLCAVLTTLALAVVAIQSGEAATMRRAVV